MKYLIAIALGLFLFAPTTAFAEGLADCDAGSRYSCECADGSGASAHIKSNNYQGSTDDCKQYCLDWRTERLQNGLTTPESHYKMQCHVATVWSPVVLAPIYDNGTPGDDVSAYPISACIPGSAQCLCSPVDNDAEPYASYSGGDPLQTVDNCRDYCEALSSTVAGQNYAIINGGIPESYAYQCVQTIENVERVVTVATAPLTEIDVGDAHNDAIAANTVSPLTGRSLLAGGAIIPYLSVAIPGLTREDLEAALSNDSSGKVQNNFIGIYIVAIYNLLLALSAFIAVAVFMVAGVMWLTSGGNSGSIGTAKDMMLNAVVGMVLLFGAYTIGSFIDTRLVNLKPLSLDSITPQEIAPDGEHWAFSSRDDLPNDRSLINESGNLIVMANDNQMITEAIPDLQAALDAFHKETGLSAILTSGSRTTRRQLELFYEHCLSKPGGVCTPPTCNPASGSAVIERANGGWKLKGSLANETDKTTIINVLEQNSNPGKCPHTSGVAIDIWCARNKGRDYVYEPVCQTELTKALVDNGFCRLKEEPWHFEYNTYKLSSSCQLSDSAAYMRKNGTLQTPDMDCEKWSYRDNTCTD